VLGTAGAAVAKPGTAVAQTAAGKQTIVIASPRPAGATPAKIMTAMPKGVAGTPGAQYIVMTSRPGTPGSSTVSIPGAATPGRVISVYYITVISTVNYCPVSLTRSLIDCKLPQKLILQILTIEWLRERTE